eukprot:389684_1
MNVRLSNVVMYLFLTISSVITIQQSAEIETTGKWQYWGGNLKNQQIALHTSKHFNAAKLKSKSSEILYEEKCKYNIEGGQTGPINVDNNNNAIFVNYNHLVSYNLNSCTENWSRDIAQLLGFGVGLIISRDFVSIYNNHNLQSDDYSILFGAPNFQNFSLAGNGCFAISVSGRNGSVQWILKLANGIQSIACFAHGFTIDGQYAYGGISSHGWSVQYNVHGFQGKMVKIDLLNGLISNEWYTTNPKIFPTGRADNSSYTGGGIWGWVSIIHDYLIFGTGQFLSVPDYINDCFRSNGTDINYNTYSFNPCGENVADDTLYWKCMENGTYPGSLVVLNKTDFSLHFAVPLVGMDVWNWFDENFGGFSNSNTTAAFIGPDADLSAVSSYVDETTGHIYAAALNKAGMFYTFDLNTKEVKIAKKVGPWSTSGGGLYSLAIDEKNLIAIATITGGRFDNLNANPVWNDYRYILADGNIVCKGGIVHAIDLRTGFTKWQFIDPYSLMNNNTLCYPNDGRYYDVTLYGQCERAFNGSEMLHASHTAKVIYGEKRLPIPINIDGTMRGSVVIVNDLVLIPSVSGDVYIIDIVNGEYITSIGCPNWNIEFDNVTNETIWFRSIIRNMPTVFDNSVILWCQNTDQFIPSQLFHIQMNIGVDEDTGSNVVKITVIVVSCVISVILIGIFVYCIFKRQVMRKETYQSIKD